MSIKDFSDIYLILEIIENEDRKNEKCYKEYNIRCDFKKAYQIIIPF